MWYLCFGWLKICESVWKNGQYRLSCSHLCQVWNQHPTFSLCCKKKHNFFLKTRPTMSVLSDVLTIFNYLKQSMTKVINFKPSAQSITELNCTCMKQKLCNSSSFNLGHELINQASYFCLTEMFVFGNRSGNLSFHLFI